MIEFKEAMIEQEESLILSFANVFELHFISILLSIIRL